MRPNIVLPRIAVMTALLPLLGISCVLPQRTRSIIPPTNERMLCQEDNRFFYSTVYDYCWRYPSKTWLSSSNTGPLTVPEQAMTVNTFSLPVDGMNRPVFHLYVTAYSAEQSEAMTAQGITVVHDADPYTIGYHYADPYPPELEQQKAEINDMLRSIQVFAPPAGRE